MKQNFTKYAFTESVKKLQDKFGSRSSYARMEEGADRYLLTDREIDFIQQRDSFYLGTVGENGWPYVQHRGGSKGFLKVLDEATLGYADLRGNRQYISTGNINANAKASLFLMNYPAQQRLKIWAESEIIHADQNHPMFSKFEQESVDLVVEQVVIFKVKAFDWNCPKFITPRYTPEEIDSL